ncbi:uncharacterized protein A4U43_C04F26660 [Asparagus officinalis]|uniref:Uncharacterized protein n=1 Tax=Asparagus officinalis TaxID=4686 RepID=A0A5P1F5M1_ASPOF|nr:uncharacterized protein A4U43_C04F26660 [Asparagus officinalis]
MLPLVLALASLPRWRSCRVQQLCRHSAKVSSVSYLTPRRSQSGKRVSFRLPEDADIHVYDCDDEKKDIELMS